MKRGGPLKRKTPLKAKKGLKRSAIPRGNAELKRSPLRAKPKPRRSAQARRMSEAWRRAVIARVGRDVASGFLVCPVCEKLHYERDMEAHHVIRQEVLKRYVRALRLPREEADETLLRLLWDGRNGLGICGRCHRRHSWAKRRIPRRCLLAANREFAAEIGLDRYLDAEYA